MLTYTHRHTVVYESLINLFHFEVSDISLKVQPLHLVELLGLGCLHKAMQISTNFDLSTRNLDNILSLAQCEILSWFAIDTWMFAMGLTGDSLPSSNKPVNNVLKIFLLTASYLRLTIGCGKVS